MLYLLRLKSCILPSSCAGGKLVGAACSRDSSPHRGYKPLLPKRNIQSLTSIGSHNCGFPRRCGFQDGYTGKAKLNHYRPGCSLGLSVSNRPWGTHQNRTHWTPCHGTPTSQRLRYVKERRITITPPRRSRNPILCAVP